MREVSHALRAEHAAQALEGVCKTKNIVNQIGIVETALQVVVQLQDITVEILNDLLSLGQKLAKGLLADAVDEFHA